jgi:hypothetical protein
VKRAERAIAFIGLGKQANGQRKQARSVGAAYVARVTDHTAHPFVDHTLSLVLAGLQIARDAPLNPLTISAAILAALLIWRAFGLLLIVGLAAWLAIWLGWL